LKQKINSKKTFENLIYRKYIEEFLNNFVLYRNMEKEAGISRFYLNKRAQVTLFIILAIIIVGIAVLTYLLIPKVETETGFDAQNPRAFIETCLEQDIEETVELLSNQGGSLVPENYFVYQGNQIEYLCYTNEYYRTCVIQQPLLKQHIEEEIKSEISDEVEACFDSLEDTYKRDGYLVDLRRGLTKVELLPKRIAVNFEGYILTATKGERSIHDSFNVILNNNLYELTSIANSIIEWEAEYGEAEVTIYMLYYKDLKVEKKAQEDGTTIYIITDRNTGNKFQFASRSAVLPLGFSS
jgi:hypothetical protein